MNFRAVRFALVPAIVFAFGAAVVYYAPPSYACPQTLKVEVCGGDGQIDVSGEDGRTPDPKQDPGSSNSILSIDCATSAEKQLSGLGDIAPGASTLTCGNQTVVCHADGAFTGRRERAAVQVEQQPDGSWQYAGNTCLAAARPQVTPELVREQAVRLVPSAAVGLAPHGSTLVNIETVMWVSAPRVEQLPPVTLLGRTVRIRLVRAGVSWDFGDGVRQDGPAGKPYDQRGDPCRTKQCADYFGHVYRHTGRVRVSATVAWRASFTVDGDGVVEIPGTVAGPAGTAPLTVKQARAVLVPDPGDGP